MPTPSAPVTQEVDAQYLNIALGPTLSTASAPGVTPRLTSHRLQNTYVYTSSPGTLVPSDACITDVLTVTVASAPRIADVNVGLNIDFIYARGILTAVLYSPSHISVTLLSQDYSGFYANYDLRLDDESLNPIEDGNDDDTAPPIYDRDAMPSERLTAFDGKTAQGQWVLKVCGNSAPIPGTLNTWTLWFTLRDPAPAYAMPANHKVAPYKIEEGSSGPYIIVITNTGELTGTATTIYDELPPEALQNGPATYTLGSGVVVSKFHATTPITWFGRIPPGKGLTITVPATVTALSGTRITNTVIISDPHMMDPTILLGPSVLYPASSIHDYEDFNTDGGGFVADSEAWQWGMPGTTGPLTCHSHPTCWHSTYKAPGILTRTFALPTLLPTQTLQLQWWEWLDIAEDWDNAVVLLTSALTPTLNILYGQISGMGLLPEQRANERQWHEVQRDLTPYASDTITLYFYAIPRIPAPKSGWFIDDLGIHVQEAKPNFSGSYKTVHTDKVAPGDTLTYTIYITNSGYLTSTQAHMVDTLPAGLRVSSTVKYGGGALASGSDWVAWTTSPTLPLAPREDVTITITTIVSADIGCGQTLTSAATITDALALDNVHLEAGPTFVYPAVYQTWNFEADTGGFMSNTIGVWTWGNPNAAMYPAGPPAAHSGQNAWVTTLDGPYDGELSVLTKTVDLSGVTPDTGLTLQWWEWLDAHDEWHQAFVTIASTAHPTPTTIYGQEQEGLTEEQRSHEKTWHPTSVDISAWAGQQVTLTFTLRLDTNALASTLPAIFPGWAIDDVSIHADCAHVSIAPGQQRRICPGDTTVYTLIARNATASADILEPTWEGNTWPISINPLALPLDAGKTGAFTISVTAPWSTELGDEDTVNVTLMGTGSGMSDTARVTTQVGPQWIQASPVPTDIILHALMAHGEESYLIGGSYEGNPVTPTRKYSPTTDTWYDLATPLTPEIYSTRDACLGTDSSDNPVIVVFPTEGQSAHGIQIYNIASDMWYTAPYTSPLPASGLTVPAIVSDQDHNRCYLTGGQDSSGVTNTLYAYDVASGTVTSLPAMTTPRYFHAAWLYGNMVCVGGGLPLELAGSVSPLDSTQCYSITAHTWLSENTTLGPLPYATWAMADTQTLINGTQQLWMLGGVRTYAWMMLTAEDRTTHWDADTLTWTMDALLPEPVFLSSADVQQGDIYVVGGAVSGAGLTASAFNQRYIQCPTSPPVQWRKWIDGEVWQAGISRTVQTSATLLIVESISTPHTITLIEQWDPTRLTRNGHRATSGTVITADGMLTWTLSGSQVATLTQEIRALPSTWTETQIHETLWVTGAPHETRPISIYKLAPQLHIDSLYETDIYASDHATLTLVYSNTGGYENGVTLYGHFPPAARFITATRVPDWQDATGSIARWDVGNLAQDERDSFRVTVAITEAVAPGTFIPITGQIHDHTDTVHDAITATFHIQCMALTDVALSRTDTGTVYTDTVVNLQADFTPDRASKPTTYTLDFDDGTPQISGTTYEDPHPLSHTFATTGEHAVQISAWNCSVGQAVTHGLTLTAYAPGTCVELTQITIHGPTRGAAPGPYTFTTTYAPPEASQPISYIWDNGDTISSTARVLDVGVHTLIITTTNGCSTVTDTHTITINPAPVCTQVTGVDLAVTSAGTVYTDTIVEFTADISPNDISIPYTYTLNGGAVQTGTAKPLVFTQTFPTTGRHSVAVAVWNCAILQADAATDTITLTVRLPGQEVGLDRVIIQGATTGEPGDYTFTTDYTPFDASTPISYQWDNGDTTVSSTRALTLGAHTLTVTAINPVNTVTDTHTVTISPVSVCTQVTAVILTRVTPIPIYTDTHVTFSADVVPDNAHKPYTYTLDYGPGPSAPASSHADPLTAISYTFTTTGSHTVEIAVWNCAMQSTAAITDKLRLTVIQHGILPSFIYLPLVLRNDTQ
jgi:uncharacterized repeat protein (TIGR01451 family)